MTDQPVSVTLNTAADLIEERGWVHGEGWPGAEPDMPHDHPLCLEGGIMAALGMRYDDYFKGFKTCPAYVAVRTYLPRNTIPFSWNDAAGRTASEVIEVLRACALIEAAREDQDAAEATYAENLAVSA